MYEELVKKLRSHNGWALNETLNEAADAIEELSRIVKAYQRFDGFLAAHGMFEQEPMIPICPLKEERVNVSSAMDAERLNRDMAERLCCTLKEIALQMGVGA